MNEGVSSHDLVDRFRQAAGKSGATVESVHSEPEALLAAVARAVLGADTVVLADVTGLSSELRRALRRVPKVISDPTDDDLCVAGAGITEAVVGVSTTGSICIRIDDRLTGLASLMAPLHVAILHADTLVERPGDVLSSQNAGGIGMTSDFVFVTGPSATADMGPLVRGVHGPHRLHIIVME
jgi:L-lactate dehydrogenase complex protein LldG